MPAFTKRQVFMFLLLFTIIAHAIPVTSPEPQVLAFAGSTRTESINKKLVQQAAEVAREMGAKVTVIDLKNYPIPLYDGDLEAESGMPENAKRIRDLMIKSQAVIIASPEYNGSIPAVLKNLIDWASRSESGGYSNDAFKGKFFALMSASPGKLGGSRALVHLQNIIEGVGGFVAEKKVSVPNAYERKASKGELREEIQEILQH